MTVQCITCQHFSLRSAGQMGHQGYGHCSFEASRAVFLSAVFERRCDKFRAVDSDEADKRQAWLKWEKQRFLKELGL